MGFNPCQTTLKISKPLLHVTADQRQLLELQLDDLHKILCIFRRKNRTFQSQSCIEGTDTNFTSKISFIMLQISDNSPMYEHVIDLVFLI
jgi:hypothetical protein